MAGGHSAVQAGLRRAGLALPTLAESTLARLQSLVPAFAALGNPLDLTPQCPADNFIAAIEAIYADDAIDGVVAINCGLDFPEFGTGVARGIKNTGKPTTAFVLDAPGVEAEMAGAGVLRFASPERAVSALARGAGE